jgi:hypothetical protein
VGRDRRKRELGMWGGEDDKGKVGREGEGGEKERESGEDGRKVMWGHEERDKGKVGRDGKQGRRVM